MRLTKKRDGKNVIPLLNAVCGIDMPYWKVAKANDLEAFLYGAAADKLAAYEDGESPADDGGNCEVVEVRHGQWNEVEHGKNGVLYECSVCKEWILFYYGFNANYCPNCGAKMDGGQDDG